MTTAIKALNRFRQRPFSTYASVQNHLFSAYIPRLSQSSRIRYEKLKGEIIDRISRFPKDDLDKPLEDLYLLGYDLQRNAFFKKSNTDEQTSMDLGAPENDAE